RRTMEGLPFEVWGGGQLRDFNFIDDVVDALLRAGALGRAQGMIYNLGAAPVTLLELAAMFVNIAGAKYMVKKFPKDRKAIDIGDYHADFNRIKQDLGWQPRTSLQEAVQRTVQFYRQHWRQYVC